MDMKFKPDERMMVAYLYGELDRNEREKVETYLRESPEAMQEYERLSSLRELLGQLPEKEVIEPIIMGPGKAVTGNFWRWTFFRKLASIAAVLLILMVAGKITGARISIGNSEVIMGFLEEDQQTQLPPNQILDKEEVRFMIQDALSQYDRQVSDVPPVSQSNLEEKLNQQLQERARQLDLKIQRSSWGSKEQLEVYFEEMKIQNRNLLEGYWIMASNLQMENMEALLTEFAQNLQQMREEDLVYLQTRMNWMENDKNLFQSETEKALADLIMNVGNIEKQ